VNAYLTAAIVLVGGLCVLNLLLTYGVVRRLREHNELLAQRPPAAPDVIAGAGSEVGAFTASTVNGDTLTSDDLATGTMVGFFSPGCSACVEQLPRFVDVAAAHPGGQDRVLAVVAGSEDGATKYVSSLSPTAQVVVGRHGAEIEKAFAIQGYPAFALVSGGVVTVSGDLEKVASVANAAV
jgi:hypothetical protein